GGTPATRTMSLLPARAAPRTRRASPRRVCCPAPPPGEGYEDARMRVLATRRLPGPAFDELDAVRIAPLENVERSPGVEALIVANETVDDCVLDRLPDLRLVANFGVGYDRIDVAACRRRGVAVTNTPGVLDAATADLAMALLLAAQRRVVAGDREDRAG